MNLKNEVIKHWEENLKKAENAQLPTLGRGACLYCRIYANPTECGRCPIKAKTGENYCTGTPYYRVTFEAKMVKERRLAGVSHRIIWKNLIAAIKEEIAFLHSLPED